MLIHCIITSRYVQCHHFPVVIILLLEYIRYTKGLGSCPTFNFDGLHGTYHWIAYRDGMSRATLSCYGGMIIADPLPTNPSDTYEAECYNRPESGGDPQWQIVGYKRPHTCGYIFNSFWITPASDPYVLVGEIVYTSVTVSTGDRGYFIAYPGDGSSIRRGFSNYVSPGSSNTQTFPHTYGSPGDFSFTVYVYHPFITWATLGPQSTTWRVRSKIQSLTISADKHSIIPGEVITFSVTASHDLTSHFSKIVYGDGFFEIGTKSDYTHTYKSCGQFYFYISAYNIVSSKRVFGLEPISVNCSSKPDTHYYADKSIINVPNGEINYVTEVNDDVMNNPYDVSIEYTYGNGVMETVPAQNLSLILPFYHKYFYTTDDSDHDVITSLDVHNIYGNSYAETQIDIEEIISGLEFNILPDDFSVVSGSYVTFNVSVTAGSHVNFTLTYGDGQEFAWSHPMKFASDFPLFEGYTYPFYGYFTPTIIAKNQVSNMNLSLPNIAVQDPITKLILHGPDQAPVQFPAGEATFTITVPVGFTSPQDVICSWLGPGVNVTSDASSLATRQPHTKELVLDVEYVGNVTIDVSCSNLVSSFVMTSTFVFKEKLRGVHAAFQSNAVAVGETFIVYVSCDEGSHAHIEVTFGNGFVGLDSYAAVSVRGEMVPISHVYHEKGNYTMTVTLSNGISTVTKVLPESAIIQNPVVNLTVTQSIIDNYEDGFATIVLDPSTMSLPPSEVFVKWIYPDHSIETNFMVALSRNEVVRKIYVLPDDTGPGTHPIEANCSNMVSWERHAINFTTMIPNDVVSINVNQLSIEVGEVVDFTYIFNKGTHGDFNLIFGDGSSHIIRYKDMVQRIDSAYGYNPYMGLISMDIGSGIIVDLELDGLAYGRSFNEWLGKVQRITAQRRYVSPGAFTPGITAINSVATHATSLDETLYVQYKLHEGFEMTLSSPIPSEPGLATFTFSVTREPTPTAVNCRMVFSNGKTEITRYVNAEPEFGRPFAAYASVSGLVGNVTVEANCSNQISHLILKSSFEVQESIRGFSIPVEYVTNSYSSLEHLTFSILTASGSSRQLSVDFGDGTQPASYDIPDAVLQYEFSHIYERPGLYSMKMVVENDFHSIEKISNIQIHPNLGQSDLAIGGNVFVAIPPSSGRIDVYDPDGVLGQPNTSFSWSLHSNSGDLIKTYNSSSNDGMHVSCSGETTYLATLMLRNPLGEREFESEVRCQNVIDPKSVALYIIDGEHKVQLRKGGSGIPYDYPTKLMAHAGYGTDVHFRWILDDVELTNESSKTSLEHHFEGASHFSLLLVAFNGVSNYTYDFHLESMERVLISHISPVFDIVPRVETLFTVMFSVLGKLHCTKVTPGRGLESLYFGPGCNSDNSSVKGTFVGKDTLKFPYSFSENGAYIMVLETKNPASIDVREFKLAVNDKPCIPPEVTLQGLGRNPERPRVEFKSSSIRVSAFTYISCQVTSKVIFKWFLKREGSTSNMTLLDFSETSEIVFDPLYFELGKYHLKLTVNMENTFGLTKEDNIYLLVSPTPLSVYINGGVGVNQGWNMTLIMNAYDETYDPDFHPPSHKRGLTFSWSCKINRDSASSVSRKIDSIQLEHNLVNSVDDSNCFKLSEVRELGPGILAIPTGQLRIDASYNYTVTVKKDDKIASYSQLVTIVYGKPPTLQIRCVRNCGKKANPSNSIVLTVSCVSCQPQDQPSYEWQFFEEDVVAESLYPVPPLPGVDISKSNLIIPGYMLEGGKLFRARAYVRLGKMSNQGYNDFGFLTNLPPYNGRCWVSPSQGYAMQTDFAVKCDGWEDEGEYLTRAEGKTNSVEPSLTFRVSTRVTTTSEAIIFLMETSLPDIGPFKLPEGDIGKQYERHLIVSVIDAYGEFQSMPFSIHVRPPTIGIVSAIDFVATPGNQSVSRMDQILGSENVQFAVSSLLTAGSVLYSAGTSANNQENTVSEAQTLITKGFNKISKYATTYDSVMQCSTALEVIIPPTPSHESQVNVIETVQNLAKSVLSMDSLSWEQSLAAVESLYSSLSLTETKSAETVREIDSHIQTDMSLNRIIQDQNDDVDAVLSPAQLKNKLENDKVLYLEKRKKEADEARMLVQTGENLMNRLRAMLINGSVQGEEETKLQSDIFVAAILPVTEEDILNGPGVSLNEFGMMKLDQMSSEGSFVLTAKGYKENPFVWPESAAFINSPVISVSLEEKGVSSKRRKRSTSGPGLSATLSVNRPEEDPVEVIPYSNEELTYHSINMTSRDNLLLIELMPSNESIIYKLFLLENGFPNTTYFDQKANLDAGSSFKTYFNDSFNLNSTYRIGIKQYVNTASGQVSLDPQLKYSVYIYEVGCRQYIESEERWTSEDCAIDPASLFNSSTNGVHQIRIRSNTMQSVAAGLFPPPNMIDFNAVFSNFAERLLDSPVVLAVILFFIIIYIPVLIWVRRKDIKDQLKWTEWNVSENSEDDKYVYKLYIHTGIKRKAATRSKVYIQLIGAKGKTSFRLLQGHRHEGFGTGSVFIYILTSSESLGKLQYARIGHDNSGEGSYKGWYLSELLVEEVQNKDRYTFLCHQWMDTEEDDGKIERVLSVDEAGTSKQFQHLISRWTRKTLFDNHLWFSVFIRTERSNFTRAQRLTCCLTILFLTMVTNAMWYREDASTSKQPFTLVIGPLIITYYQLYASIMSTLIVFPVSLLLIQIYRKTDATTLTFKEAIEDFKAFKRRNMIDKGIQMDSPSWIVPLDDEEDFVGVTTEHIWKSTKTKKLPYVMIYFGWIICFLATVTSAFFTFMYSLQWGGEKANMWLSTFILSTGENIGIFSTAQVLIIAIVFAWLMKEPDEEEKEDEVEVRNTLFLSNHDKRLEIMHNREMSIHRSLLEMVRSLRYNCLNLNDPNHSGLDIKTDGESDTDKAMARKKENQRIFFFLVGFFFRVLYIICLMIVSYGSVSKYGNVLHNDITGTFGIDDSLVRESGPKAFWQWAEDTFLPALYGGDWYNGKKASWRERRFIYNRECFRVGPARFRQMRVVPGNCAMVKQMEPFLIECNPEFSIGGQDMRHFLPNWLHAPWNLTDEYKTGSSPFVYRDSSELQGLPVYGHFNIYDGGGYKTDIAEEYDEAIKQVGELKRNDWLDLYTRAVSVEFTIYNANDNFFSHVLLLFEMPSTGGILSLIFVEPFKVYSDSDSDGVAVFIAQMTSLVMFIYYTGSAFRSFRRSKPRTDFFKSIENLFELVHIFLGFGVISLFFMKNVKTSSAVGEVLGAKGLFYNFHGLAITTYTYVSVLGLAIFVNAILLLGVLQVSWRFRVMANLLRKGAASFIAFFIQFSILDIGFVTFFYTYFGKRRMEYSTFLTTFGSMFAVFLGGGANFKIGVAAGEDEFGRFMIVLFSIIMVFAFTNVFISMIIQLIDEATDIVDDLGQQELDPVGYMKDGLLKLMKEFKYFVRDLKVVFNSFRFKKKVN